MTMHRTGNTVLALLIVRRALLRRVIMLRERRSKLDGSVSGEKSTKRVSLVVPALTEDSETTTAVTELGLANDEPESKLVYAPPAYKLEEDEVDED
jgi:hypothetical protein